MINTTLNIKHSLLNKINNVALISNFTRSKIIILLLQRMMKDIDTLFNSNPCVKYQNSIDENDNFHKFHISLAEYQYEYFIDMRKMYKRSVSFILAFAIENYLDEILDLITNEKQKINTDNYLRKNYIIFGQTVDGVTCWKLFWGIPPNLEKIIEYS